MYPIDMKYDFFTPDTLVRDISQLNESSNWVLHLNYTGDPFETFTDIPFLTTGESGRLSEQGMAILVFSSKYQASKALEMIKEKGSSFVKASLIHKGILIDSI